MQITDIKRSKSHHRFFNDGPAFSLPSTLATSAFPHMPWPPFFEEGDYNSTEKEGLRCYGPGKRGWF
jgi:hypothetical protein